MLIKAEIIIPGSIMDQSPINGDNPIIMAKEELIRRLCKELYSKLMNTDDWMIIKSTTHDDGVKYATSLSIYNENEVDSIYKKINKSK